MMFHIVDCQYVNCKGYLAPNEIREWNSRCFGMKSVEVPVTWGTIPITSGSSAPRPRSGSYWLLR